MSSSMELEVEYVVVVRRSEHVGQFVFRLEWCIMDESDMFLSLKCDTFLHGGARFLQNF